MSRWMRLGIATITSTALVGGALVTVPSHPLLSPTQVASAQEIPANADAYAFAQQLNLSAPGIEDLLTTDDERGVAAILTLLEAEQAWEAAGDNGQDPELSGIELELLGLLNIDLGAVTVPLVGAGGLLRLDSDAAPGEVGALRAYANAPADNKARAAVGLISDSGALNLGAGDAGANATIDLTNALGLSTGLSALLAEASLELGALSSEAHKENAASPSSSYQIAEANLVIDAPIVENAIGSVEDLIAGLDTTVNGLLGQSGALSGVLGAVSGLTAIIGTNLDVSVELPLADITNQLLDTPLADANGLVSIDLRSGNITVNLAQLHGGDLNNLPANTDLLTADQITQITDTVTSLLTDGAADNPNGLNARLQNVLMGDNGQGGLYGTEVQIEARLLGGLAGLDLKTTLGGLLNEDAVKVDNEADWEANKYGTYVQKTVGLGSLLTPLLGLLQPLLGAVGTLVEGLLFGDDAQTGLLSGLLGNVQNQVIAPLLVSLDPLLTGVVSPLASVVVNRQTTEGELFTVSALELNLLSGALVLPIATSAVAALDESATPTDEPTTTPPTDEPTTTPPTDEPTTTPPTDEPTTTPPTDEPTTTPTTPAGSSGDDFISGSSDFLQKCMTSPAGAVTGILAVLGTAAAIGGPAIEPLVKALGGQLDAQLRAMSSNFGVNQPAWAQGINKGLNDAANAVDSRMVAAALFATALGALVAAPALCEAEGSSGSSGSSI